MCLERETSDVIAMSSMLWVCYVLGENEME